MAKEKVTSEVDPMAKIAKQMEAQYRLLRIDTMGRFQNEIVKIVDSSNLMSQDICFVLDVVKDNVRVNFLKLLAYKEAMDKKASEEKTEKPKGK